PWTLIASALPRTPPSAPNATEREIALQASATFSIRPLKSPLALGKRRRSSIRNRVNVVRLAIIMVTSRFASNRVDWSSLGDQRRNRMRLGDPGTHLGDYWLIVLLTEDR